MITYAISEAIISGRITAPVRPNVATASPWCNPASHARPQVLATTLFRFQMLLIWTRPDIVLPCARLACLGGVSLCGAAFDRAFLPTSDGPSALEIVRQLRNAAHELAVIICTVYALRHQVGNSTASREQHIGDT
jgi:hypothetical protein